MAVIAIDFDDTLVHIDKRLEGAKEAINLLREAGHKIIIHSCNNPEWIEKVLNDQDLRYDLIWCKKWGGKPAADIYIDNKGFRFENWTSQIKEILELVNGLDNRKW